MGHFVCWMKTIIITLVNTAAEFNVEDEERDNFIVTLGKPLRLPCQSWGVFSKPDSLQIDLPS